MLTATQFFLAALLAACQCKTQVRSEVFNDNESFKNVTKCKWNCKVIESDLPKQINTNLAKNRVIIVTVKSRIKVDETFCANETSLYSSTVATKKLQIWRPENNTKPASFAQAIERVVNLLFSSDCKTCRVFREIQAVCNLTRTRPLLKNETSSDPAVLPDVIRGHLRDLEINFDSMNISNDYNSTGNSTSNHFERSEGLNAQILAFAMVFVIAFVHYSPAFFCLFCPTVVTENGIRHISLEGTSPIGIRSLVGNYFCSEDDENLCNRTKRFIARAVLVPLPFLIPALAFDYIFFHHDQTGDIGSEILVTFDLRQPFFLVWLTFYFLQAFFDSFFNVSAIKEPCLICRFLKPKLRCNDNLPRKILNHLRLQPLILVKCGRLFCRCLVRYSKMYRFILSSWQLSWRESYASTSWLLRFTMFIVFLLTIPFAAVIILVAMLVVVTISTLRFTSPIGVITSIGAPKVVIKRNYCFLCILAFIRRFLSHIILVAAYIVLFEAACGFTTAIAILFYMLLFFEKGLPYLVCFVLFFYYLWSSYSSFTNKYHDLSLMLFKVYKQTQQDDEIFGEEPQMDLEKLLCMPCNSFSKRYEVKIPVELLNMACEELMPIREGVCILLLKVTLILSFVYLTFLLILRFDFGATPVMQALATFFTGSFPKILAIYFDGKRQRRLEYTVIEENVPKIVRDYMKRTPMTIEMVTFKDND